jgi:cobalamin biosynthesis protein CobT
MAVKKASFNLPEEDLDELRRLAAERNVSVTYALRQAISDSAFLQDEIINDKNKLLVQQSKDGTTREVSVRR